MIDECQIQILCRGRLLFSIELTKEDCPYTVDRPQTIFAGDSFGVVLRRSERTRAMRLKLGTEVIWEFSADAAIEAADAFDPGAASSAAEDLPITFAEQTDMRAWLRNELGDSQIVLELDEPEQDGFVPMFVLPLQVTPRPSVYRDFLALLEDIVHVHGGLVQDVVGRAWIKQGVLGEAVTKLHPQPLMDYLDQLCDNLTHGIHEIARQPSKQLTKETVTVRYRGGDILDNSSISSIVRSRETRVDRTGRIQNIGKTRIRRPILTEDNEEHRQIAAGIRRLAEKSLELSRHCLSTAELLASERQRWGAMMGDSPSVYQKVHAPRVEAYKQLAERAEKVSQEFKKLIQRYSFLAHAEKPRLPFGPTPLFFGRPAYREVYRCLLDAKQKFGFLVDEDSVRIHYKDFPTLFEMWCFLQTVAYLSERLGTPKPVPAFGFQEDIYHPSLVPGQTFVYKINRHVRVEVCYEKEFAPWKRNRNKAQELRWAAAFTSEPLRPDITVTVFYEDDPPTMLILDAKSTDSFSFSKFREMTDYSRQIFDPQTGYQPVKQVFLIHRDRSRTSLSNMTNIPHYLREPDIPFHAVVLGAIPAIPGDEDRSCDTLTRVLDLFLLLYADLPLP